MVDLGNWTPSWALNLSGSCTPSGACELANYSPPKNIAEDGCVTNANGNNNCDGKYQGSNIDWRNYVSKFASHLMANTRGVHVSGYELYNEFTREANYSGTASWLGTPNQMLRLAEDANCIIVGRIATVHATGETCAQVRATVTSVTLTGPIDPTANMLTPSSNDYGSAVYITNLNAYLNNTCGGTCAGAASAAADVLALHTYSHNNSRLPIAEDVSTDFQSFYAQITDTRALTLPVWTTEGDYGGWGNLPSLEMQAGFIVKYFAVLKSLNFQKVYLYGYDDNYCSATAANGGEGCLWIANGMTWGGTSGTWFTCSQAQGCLLQAGTAYQQMTTWLPGATVTQACSASGTIWTCNFTAADGVTQLRMAWDSSQSCSNGTACPYPTTFPASGSLDPKWTSYTDIYGNVVPITTSTVGIGYLPVLLKAQAYTITSQPPVTSPSFFYNDSASLFTKRIPNAGNGGPYSHLMPGGTTVLQTQIGWDSHGNAPPPAGASGGTLTGGWASWGARDQSGQPMYISKLTDPVYKIIAPRCGSTFEPLAARDGNGNLTNLLLHAPNGAAASGCVAGTTCSSDSAINVWDLSGDTADISNGYAIHMYSDATGMALPLKSGSGHAGTIADPIPYNAPGGGSYCGWANPASGRDYDNGAGAISNSAAPYSAMNRWAEMVNGHFYHAQHAVAFCEGTSGGNEPNVVFPNSGSRLTTGTPAYWGDSGALKCSNQATSWPNGALFFLDYTQAQLDCMDPGKPGTTCNGADGNPIVKLDPAHFAYIEQLTLYGWYEADTGGAGPLGQYHQEGGEAYLYYHNAGVTSPDPLTGTCQFCFQTYENYMATHCPGPYTDGTKWCYPLSPDSNDGQAYELRIWYAMPTTLPGPNNGANDCSLAAATAGNCGVGKHLFIADPCVAVGLAGLAEDPTGQWSACASN